MAGPWEEYAQTPAAEAGPWSEYAAAPATPSRVKMKPADFNTELLKRARSGEAPDAIRAWAASVSPEEDETGMIGYTVGPELETVTERMQVGYTGPVSIRDTTQRNDALPSALRGAASALTFNRDDQIQAGLQAAFGDGTYDEYLFNARAERAMDDPTARFAGQLAGAFAPVGGAALLSKAPGAVGAGARALTAGYDKLLNSGGILGRVGKAAGVGAVANVLGGTGAADDRPYGVGEAATDAVTGAMLAPVAPIAGAAVTGIRNFVSPESGAIAALVEAGLDPRVLQQRIANQFKDTGKAPNIMEVLTEEEAARFTGVLSRSRDARTRVLTDANTRMENLGPGIQDQVLPKPTGPVFPGQRGSRVPETPGDITRATREQGDRDFSAFRDRKAALDPTDRTVLEQNVLPNLSLGGKFKADLVDALAEGRVTGEMFDILRRQIDSLAQAKDPKVKYQGRALREDFLPILENAFPESAPAVRRMAAGYARAEGAEAGAAAANASRDLLKSIDELAALSPAQVRGTEAGARAQLVTEAYGNPRQSYRLASSLATDPGYIGVLGRALGNPQEAQALARYAMANKKAIDASFAAARVPLDKVESTLQNAEGLIDIATASVLGGGGAFKAGIANRILAEVGLGKGVADKLADVLLDPTKRAGAIAKLEKAGVSRNQWRSMVRDTYMGLIGSIANPAVAPEGVVTVEPQ